MGFRVLQCDGDFMLEEGSSAQSSANTNVFAERRSNLGSTESKIDSDNDSWTRKEQKICNNRVDKENRQVQSSKNLTSLGGLGKEFMYLLKKSSQDQQIFYGKRKPLVDVSAGRKNLQAKAESKRELEKIHRKLTEFC
jgi:hypothetical protein